MFAIGSMRTICTILLIGAVLAASGCDEHKSTPVGSDVIDRDDWGRFREIYVQPATRDSVYHQALQTGGGPLLLVGEWSGYGTKSLLRFETLPESVQVASASVTLFTYDVIDTVTPAQTSVPEAVKVVVHLLQTGWSIDDVTFDTPLSGTPVETVAVGRAPDDSLIVSLPQNAVQAWIDGTEENNGLLLSCLEEPTSPQGDGFIKEFYSSDSQIDAPQLRIRCALSDTSDTTFVAAPTADVFVVRRRSEWPFDTRPDRLMVGNGYVYRTLIQFAFEDSIPDEATIVRGLLTLSVDREYSFFSALEMSVYAVTSPTWDDPQFSTSRFAQATVTADDDSVVFDIRGLVQSWVDEEIPNYGLLLKSTHEDWDIAFFTFHSSQGAGEWGPRLDVAYATPPDFGLKAPKKERKGEP